MPSGSTFMVVEFNAIEDRHVHQVKAQFNAFAILVKRVTNANLSPYNQSECSRVKYAPVSHGQDVLPIIVAYVISSGDDLMVDEHDVTKIVMMIFFFLLLSCQIFMFFVKKILHLFK